MAPGRPQSLFGVEVVVEPQRRERAEHRVGIDQAIADDVEGLAAILLEEGASVIDHDVDAGVVVRPLGVQAPAELDDPRIDLHRAHAREAVSQRGLGVVAGTRAHDQGAPARLAEDEGEVVHGPHPRHQVVALDVREVEHVLVEVAVDEQRHSALRFRDVDAVVGRVDRAADGRLAQGNDGGQRNYRKDAAGQPEEGRGPDQQPDRRPGLDGGDGGRGERARQRPQQVRRVGAQPAGAGEEVADRARRAREHRHDSRDEREHAQIPLRGREEGHSPGLPAPEVDRWIGKRHPREAEAIGEGEGDAHQGQQGQRRAPETRPSPADDEPDAHPQEGADEHDVGEVGEDADLPGHPADQRQLEGEDAEGADGDLEQRGAPALGPGAVAGDIHARRV